MNDEQRYLFDLQGYLVVPQVLDGAEVSALKERIEVIAKDLPDVRQIHTGFPRSAKFTNDNPANGPVNVFTSELLLWGDLFASLPLRPPISSILSELLGKGHRLDHCYAILMTADDPALGVQNLHNGGTPYEPAFRYGWHGGFDLGLVTVTFALTDEGEGVGGFGCIPGSHKSNLPLPPGWADLTAPRPEVVNVPLRTGDALVFTEALTHGTLRWRGVDRRKALLFKFMPGQLQWSERSPTVPASADPSLLELVRPAFRSGR